MVRAVPSGMWQSDVQALGAIGRRAYVRAPRQPLGVRRGDVTRFQMLVFLDLALATRSADTT